MEEPPKKRRKLSPKEDETTQNQTFENKDIDNTNETFSSRFVQCPFCLKYIYKSNVSLHIDTHDDSTSSKPNSNSQNGSKSDKNKSKSKLAFLIPQKTNSKECKLSQQSKRQQNNTKTRKNLQQANAKSTEWIKCPICNDKVLSSQINMHIDSNCDSKLRQMKEKANNKKTNNSNTKTSKHCKEYKTMVPGLYLVPNFISEEEEKELIKEVESQKWRLTEAKRRIQHYGPPMDRMYRVVASKKEFTKLPPKCLNIAEKIRLFWNNLDGILYQPNELAVVNNEFDELLVNEYHSHNCLELHFDQRGAFEELLVGISLLSDSIMTFQHCDKNYMQKNVCLPAKSCYFMTGDSRYCFKHGFLKNSISGRRISLTFRTVKKIFGGLTTNKKKINEENVRNVDNISQLQGWKLNTMNSNDKKEKGKQKQTKLPFQRDK